MSLTEKQTNKADAPLQPPRRPTRAQRKSVIAEAMRYEAVQGAPVTETTDATPSPKYSARLEQAQTSVFSAFGKDAVKDVDSFEAGRVINNAYSEKAPANDMTKQCSMVHRMMEMDKTDVDPRDLHKLLPSTMLSSESLDLRPDSKLARGKSGVVDIHELCDNQAVMFRAERGGRTTGEQDVGYEDATVRLSPTVEEQDGVSHSPKDKEQSGRVSNETAVPGSPVTGWPAAAVLGIMHPMNHTLPPVVKPSQASPPELVVSDRLVYSTSAMACLNGAPGGVLLDWTAAYGGQQQQPLYSRTSYPSTTSTPVILENPAQEEQYAMSYHQAAQGSSENASPQRALSPRESESGSSDKDKNADASSKKFKSLEAALAWCHVQHSQKQVPVVPKDDVRKLVDFQLNSGKPIRAPWYRPQTDKAQDEDLPEKPIEKKPVIPMPRPKRTPTANVKKQGTGFFCPPGSSMARV